MSTTPGPEERLRRALAEESRTTWTSPDGWERIEARAARQRPGLVRPGLLVPALAALLVAATVVALNRDDRPSRLRVAGPAEPVYLVPRSVDGRFSLLVAADQPMSSELQTRGRVRVFGRRAADGVTLTGFLAVATVSAVHDVVEDGVVRPAPALAPMPPTMAPATAVVPPGAVPAPAVAFAAPPSAPLVAYAFAAHAPMAPIPSGDGPTSVKTVTVHGQEVALGRGPNGQSSVGWQDGDSWVNLQARGLSADELLKAAESLPPGQAALAPPTVPAGFQLVHEGPFPSAPGNRLVTASWQSDDGGGFSIAITDGAGATLDTMSWQLAGARATKVRGAPALEGGRDQDVLAWVERPGTLVVVTGNGLRPGELRDIAEGLQPATAADWRKLAATARPPRRVAQLGTEVASGDAGGVHWAVTVQKQPSGTDPMSDVACIEVTTESSGSGSCFPAAVAPGEISSVGLSDRLVTAAAGTDVAKVVVRLADGTSVEATLRGTTKELGFSVVIAPLPAGARAVLVTAFDAGGREVSSQPLPAPPPVPPTRVAGAVGPVGGPPTTAVAPQPPVVVPATFPPPTTTPASLPPG